MYLLPKYVKSNDDIVNKMSDLIKSIIHAADHLKLTQETYHDAAMSLQQTIIANRQQIENMGSEMDQIKQLLREGFRLPEPNENR
jgi:small-conductance mechanosensitive channel